MAGHAMMRVRPAAAEVKNMLLKIKVLFEDCRSIVNLLLNTRNINIQQSTYKNKNLIFRVKV